jgi:hypothetical protein
MSEQAVNQEFTTSVQDDAVELKGGDGIPRSREEVARLPNLFLVRPANMKYLEGKSNMIVGDRFPVLAVFLLFLPGTIVAAVSRAPLIFTVIFALLTAALFLAVMTTFRRLMLLEREGKLLVGQLTSMRGYWRRTTRTEGARATRQNSRTWMVDVGYVVRTPDGTQVKALISQSRPDLKDALPLPSGTPVAVLYVDEKTHQSL